MDRSFESNADFKMNQRNFKLSDFGIKMEPCYAIEQRRTASRYAQIATVQSQRMQMRAGRLDSGSNGSSPLRVGCNLSQLPSNCSALTCNVSQPRRSPNRSQNVSGDRFQAASPNNLSGNVLQPAVSSVPSPGYWNQYGGQESGVNVLAESFRGE